MWVRMLEWIALLCLIGALMLLTALAYVDLKTRLLPNEMVAGFATLGLVFHLTTLAAFVPVKEIAIGAFVGFAALYLIRMVGNKFYGMDALGLGDCKLMGAAGLWLGDAIMLAMALGAGAALIHGLGDSFLRSRKTGQKTDLSRLQIPAGPGFVVGIIFAAIYQFWNFNPLN